jgi:hypothetical protein
VVLVGMARENCYSKDWARVQFAAKELAHAVPWDGGN